MLEIGSPGRPSEAQLSDVEAAKRSPPSPLDAML